MAVGPNRHFRWRQSTSFDNLKIRHLFLQNHKKINIKVPLFRLKDHRMRSTSVWRWPAVSAPASTSMAPSVAPVVSKKNQPLQHLPQPGHVGQPWEPKQALIFSFNPWIPHNPIVLSIISGDGGSRRNLATE
jgi:hypothetical protein